MKKILAVSVFVLLAAGFASAWPAMMGAGYGNQNGWNDAQGQAMQRMMQGQLQPGDVPLINAAMGRAANATAGAWDWDDMPCHGAGQVGWTQGGNAFGGMMGGSGMYGMHRAMHG